MRADARPLGRPAGGTNQIAAPTANDLAFAPRGKVDLAGLVASDVPEIGVLASSDNKLPVRKGQGCTCTTSGAAGATTGFVLAGMILLVIARRRHAPGARA